MSEKLYCGKYNCPNCSGDGCAACDNEGTVIVETPLEDKLPDDPIYTWVDRQNHGCQKVLSKRPLEFCGNTPTEEYDLAVKYNGEIVTGSAQFCDECEPPAEHRA